ncbi:MAG: hypothetical protein M0P12_12630 [Paludibacteraceae bacterium]|nr:hypothetical protein [Paludibacteraceae bacterium]
MKLIKFLSVVFLFMTFGDINAQISLHPGIDLAGMIGIKETSDEGNISTSEAQMSATSLRVKLLCDFNTKISSGLGVGLDGYSEPNYNTFPVFATINYFPFKKVKFFGLLDCGYSPKINSNYVKGLLFDAGLGYRLQFKKHFGMNFMLYYNAKQFKENYRYWIEGTEYEWNHSAWRHSISVSVGFIF